MGLGRTKFLCSQVLGHAGPLGEVVAGSAGGEQEQASRGHALHQGFRRRLGRVSHRGWARSKDASGSGL